MNKKKTNKNKSRNLIVTAGVLVIVMIGLLFVVKNNANNQEGTDGQNNSLGAQLSDKGDLMIPVAGVTDKANFYEYDADGTKLEVIAVKAPDGTIRTAFNTCQVCYSSGRGYYEQEGDELVCQNCGNRFKASDVEVSKGGCNPVPIFDENKTVDKTNITISKDYLNKAKVIFENWK